MWLQICFIPCVSSTWQSSFWLLLASLTFSPPFILFHEELSYEAICSDFPVDFLEIKKEKRIMQTSGDGMIVILGIILGTYNLGVQGPF